MQNTFSALFRTIRLPYLHVGEWVDRWYEELPWRKRIPLGLRGEQIARRYLRRRGYLILAQNYRVAGAELDLVTLDREELVFVEVKTRSSDGLGLPQEAVDETKQAHIRRAAASYVAARHARKIKVRFDVVAITGTGRRRKLELIKDAF
jgi:putative endonuclease